MTLILLHNCPLSIWQVERTFDHPGCTRFDSVVYALHLYSHSAAFHQTTTSRPNSQNRLNVLKSDRASTGLESDAIEQWILSLSARGPSCRRFLPARYSFRVESNKLRMLHRHGL